MLPAKASGGAGRTVRAGSAPADAPASKARALIAAAVNNLEVIAFPAIGTQVDGGVDKDEAARAMVDELRAHRQQKPATIYLIESDDAMLLAFEEALRNAQQAP